MPTDAEVDAFVRAIEDAGVSLVGLNFFAGDMPGGDRGLVSWPARSAEFRDNIPVVAAIGDRLGCKAFNALYGNRVDDASTPPSRTNWAPRTSRWPPRASPAIGGTVLVEPVSGSPRYPLLTAADVAAVIGRVTADGGPTNIGLLADLYHLAVNGDDVDTAIADLHRHARRHRARPDRRRPGPRRARHR